MALEDTMTDAEYQAATQRVAGGVLRVLRRAVSIEAAIRGVPAGATPDVGPILHGTLGALVHFAVEGASHADVAKLRAWAIDVIDAELSARAATSNADPIGPVAGAA